MSRERKRTRGEVSKLLPPLLLIVSLARSASCALEDGLPALPGADLKAEIEAPEKLFDGPLSPFKRLFVTTQTATVTLSTVLFCYATKKIGNRECSSSRQRRAIEINGIEGFADEGDLRSLIAPSRPSKAVAQEKEADISSSGASSRRARFINFLYPVTKTVTETRTRYTDTTTISVKCTPTSSIMPECREGKFLILFNKLFGKNGIFG